MIWVRPVVGLGVHQRGTVISTVKNVLSEVFDVGRGKFCLSSIRSFLILSDACVPLSFAKLLSYDWSRFSIWSWPNSSY